MDMVTYDYLSLNKTKKSWTTWEVDEDTNGRNKSFFKQVVAE